jgi:hypothetical protein
MASGQFSVGGRGVVSSAPNSLAYIAGRVRCGFGAENVNSLDAVSAPEARESSKELSSGSIFQRKTPISLPLPFFSRLQHLAARGYNNITIAGWCARVELVGVEGQDEHGPHMQQHKVHEEHKPGVGIHAKKPATSQAKPVDIVCSLGNSGILRDGLDTRDGDDG